MVNLSLCTARDFRVKLVIYVAEYKIFESLSVAVLEICESTVMHFLPNAQIWSSLQVHHLSELFFSAIWDTDPTIPMPADGYSAVISQ